jgi:hypothetical protein
LDGKERRRLLGKERGLLEEIELIRKWAKA